jgi:DNA modification methylase
MGDNSVDYVFTSPPYNRKRNDKYTHYDDTLIDYFGFLDSIISESIRVATKYVFLNIQKNYYNASDVYRIFGKYHDKIAEVFIWEKTNPMPASGNSITNAYEYIICFGEKGLKSNKTYTKNHLSTSVARMPKNHKAVMHMDVAEFFVKYFTKQGDTVYDPFMGTGTTALACMSNNRKWIGSEISQEYFVDSMERITSWRKNEKVLSLY